MRGRRSVPRCQWAMKTGDYEFHLKEPPQGTCSRLVLKNYVETHGGRRGNFHPWAKQFQRRGMECLRRGDPEGNQRRRRSDPLKRAARRSFLRRRLPCPAGAPHSARRSERLSLDDGLCPSARYVYRPRKTPNPHAYHDICAAGIPSPNRMVMGDIMGPDQDQL